MITHTMPSLTSKEAAYIHRSPYCKLSPVIVKERCQEGVYASSLCVQENSKKMSVKVKKETLKNGLRAYWCRAAAAKR